MLVRFQPNVPLQAPPEADRNGVIIRYDIFYREMEENSTSDTQLFSLAEYTPSQPQASSHSTRLGGLAGGKRFQVKLRAATSVGVGPNSTLVSTETLEREHFTRPQIISHSLPLLSCHF